MISDVESTCYPMNNKFTSYEKSTESTLMTRLTLSETPPTQRVRICSSLTSGFGSGSPVKVAECD